MPIPQGVVLSPGRDTLVADSVESGVPGVRPIRVGTGVVARCPEVRAVLLNPSKAILPIWSEDGDQVGRGYRSRLLWVLQPLLRGKSGQGEERLYVGLATVSKFEAGGRQHDASAISFGCLAD